MDNTYNFLMFLIFITVFHERCPTSNIVHIVLNFLNKALVAIELHNGPLEHLLRRKDSRTMPLRVTGIWNLQTSYTTSENMFIAMLAFEPSGYKSELNIRPPSPNDLSSRTSLIYQYLLWLGEIVTTGFLF